VERLQAPERPSPATAEQNVKDLPEQINVASRYDQSGSGAELDVFVTVQA
jgi:hypothetical protein